MTLPNKQPVESRSVSDGSTLDVHSVFPTIQGEGPFSGRAATFLRLAGCNLQCPLCDTQYTEGRTRWAARALVSYIKEQPATLVVITGGEPFRQNIAPLCTELVQQGYIVQIETNGRLAPQDFLDLMYLCDTGRLHVVVSPKTARVHPDCAALATAWKYVVRADDVWEDGLPTLALGLDIGAPHIARPPENWVGPIYVHPADEQDPERNELNLDAAVSAVLQYPEQDRRLGLQVHKYAGLE